MLRARVEVPLENPLTSFAILDHPNPSDGQCAGRGPVRIFSRIGKGPGAQWGRRQTCMGLVIVPNEGKSPSIPSSCNLVEIEDTANITVILAGAAQDTGGGNESAAMEAIEEDPALAAGDKRQVSTESLQPALKRQRP
ncbi:hypothetical protein ACHQM5_012964 [Ranunculus cassubicifolius]